MIITLTLLLLLLLLLYPIIQFYFQNTFKSAFHKSKKKHQHTLLCTKTTQQLSFKHYMLWKNVCTVYFCTILSYKVNNMLPSFTGTKNYVSYLRLAPNNTVAMSAVKVILLCIESLNTFYNAVSLFSLKNMYCHASNYQFTTYMHVGFCLSLLQHFCQ